MVGNRFTEEFFRMPEIKEGHCVVPTPRTLQSAPMMAQLQRRTSLTEEELRDGHLKVRKTDDKGHAVLVHPRLSEPFSCHTKFFERAPQ